MLSPYRQAKAREVFNLFTLLNSASWTFIAANVVTLFALRCDASSTVIGVLSSLAYISYFFLPIGKIAARRIPIIKIFQSAWIARSLCMSPFVVAPFAVLLGYKQFALVLLVAAVALFQFFRGIGMVSNNPVLNFLATGPDKSSYMTQTQIINNAVSMFAGFVVALCLGGGAVWVYSIIAAAGVVCGVSAGVCIGRVPEPPREAAAAPVPLVKTFKQAFANVPVKNFITIFFLVALCSGVARTFIIVFAREVFFQSDGMVSLYGVFGAFGSFLIGLCIKFLVERIGAKPLFIICTALGLFGILILIFIQTGSIAANVSATVMLLSLLFLLLNFAFIGAENVGQTYFICLVPKEQMMDMGILYFIMFGIAGAGGSFFSGIILDLFTGAGLSRLVAFRLLFAILSVLLTLALIFQRTLVSLGALPVKAALEVIFSFRDLRTIAILDKLEKSDDVEKEQELLVALHENPSRLAMAGLLERAKSPRFATRTEAFDALRAQEALSEEAEKALMDDIVSNPYTTAYQSARILGRHACAKAVPLLRNAVYSDDYMLSGEAMIALASLNDEAYRTEIEQIIEHTKNPRLQIMGVEAFGIYKSVHSLPVLFRMLKSADPPPYLRDEAVLAMANILDTYNFFHKLLVRYLADASMAAALAGDEAESACEYCKSALGAARGKTRAARESLAAVKNAAERLQSAVSALFGGEGAGDDAAGKRDSDPVPLSRFLVQIPDSLGVQEKAMILSEAILHEDLCAFDRIKLLVVQWAARMLRLWAAQVKERL